MNDSKISVRYAKALFLNAKEKNLLIEVREDMDLLLESVGGIHELKMLLESPVVESDKKMNILKEIFGGKINDLTLSFLYLVIENKREEFLPGMARRYIELFKEDKGIKIAKIVTAVQLDERSRQDIIRLIEKVYHSEVELTENINRDIIGGFILTVEDHQLDASVTGRLRKIKRDLLETSFE